LKGKALDVYARLPTEQAQDYDKLKEALLKRYMMTEEGYKQKFHGSKPEVGQKLGLPTFNTVLYNAKFS